MPSHYKKKPMKKNKPRELKKEEKDLLKIHSKSFSKKQVRGVIVKVINTH
jgi:hypothetical protein